MQLFVNVDTGAFQVSTAVSREIPLLSMKRGDSNTVSLTPVQANAVFAIPGTVSNMYFAVKADFEEASPVLILANDWTLASGVWSSPITQDVDEIETLLAGAEFKDVYAEVTWTSSTTGVFSSQTLRFRIYNDVWKGTESAPISYPVDGFATPLELTEELPVDGVAWVPHFLETSFTGSNNDLRFEQVNSAATPTIAIQGTGFPGGTFDDIVVSGNTVTVRFPILAGITASAVKTRIEGNTAASALISVSFLAGNNGSGTISETLSPTALSGGTAAVAGTDPVVLGRSAIVTHSDGTFTTWEATRLSPPVWMPTTGGIVKNRTSGQWMRTFVSSSTLQTEVLPDQ